MAFFATAVQRPLRTWTRRQAHGRCFLGEIRHGYSQSAISQGGFLRSLAGLGVFLLVVSAEGKASTEEPGANVAVALDTSGSMKKTDPAALRLEAVRLLSSLLAKQDRIALVSFDTDARVQLDLDLVQNKEPELVDLLESLRADGPFTNLYAAVEACRNLFVDVSGNKKSVVLLTDGKMDTGSPARDQQLTVRLEDELAAAMAQDKIPVYAIAFSPLADVDLLFRLAVKTRGFFYLVPDTSELSNAFVRIYEQIAKPNGLLVQGNLFRVDKSVEGMTIVVQKALPGERVLLRAPHGLVLDGTIERSGLRWFTGKTFDLIAVQNPEAGAWEFEEGAEAGRSIFVETDLCLRTSFHENAILASEKKHLEVWLEAKGTRVSPETLRAEGLELQCKLGSPSGSKTFLPLRDDGTLGDRAAADGVFTTVLRAQEVGQHCLELSARGKSFDRLIRREFVVLSPAGGIQPAQVDSHTAGEDSSISAPDPSLDPAAQTLPAFPFEANAILYPQLLAGYAVLSSLLSVLFYRNWRRALRRVTTPPGPQSTVNPLSILRAELSGPTDIASPAADAPPEPDAPREEWKRLYLKILRDLVVARSEGNTTVVGLLLDALDQTVEQGLQGLTPPGDDGTQTPYKGAGDPSDRNAEGQREGASDEQGEQDRETLRQSLQIFLRFQELRIAEFRLAEKALQHLSDKFLVIARKIREMQSKVQSKDSYLLTNPTVVSEELGRLDQELRACLGILQQESRLQMQRRQKYETRMNEEADKIFASKTSDARCAGAEGDPCSDGPDSIQALRLRVEELTETLLEKEKELLSLQDAYSALEQEYVKAYKMATETPSAS